MALISMNALDEAHRRRREICAGVRDIALDAATLIEESNHIEARRVLRNLARMMDAQGGQGLLDAPNSDRQKSDAGGKNDHD